jgi:hypothetical protein
MKPEQIIKQLKDMLDIVAEQRDRLNRLTKVPSIEKAILKHVKKYGWPK